MLQTIADDYPSGDVAAEGLFQLALYYIEKRDFSHAVTHLEHALRLEPHEHAYFTAGRLPYFLARAHLESGAVAEGLAELANVIRDYPLSYYMTLPTRASRERPRRRRPRHRRRTRP